MITTGPETAPASNYGQAPKVDMSDRANLIVELYTALGVFDPETAERAPEAVRLALEKLHKAHPELTDTHVELLEGVPGDGVDLREVVPESRMYVNEAWAGQELVVARADLSTGSLVAVGMIPDQENEFEEPGLQMTNMSHGSQRKGIDVITRTINHNDGAIRAMPYRYLSYIASGLLRQEAGAHPLDPIYTATRFVDLTPHVVAVGSRAGKIGLWPSDGKAKPTEGIRIAAVARDDELSL